MIIIPLGQTKEFFSLDKYKVGVGRDFKRIVFYLCTEKDFSNYEKILKEDDSASEVEETDKQIAAYEIFAKEIEIQWNCDDLSTSYMHAFPTGNTSSTSTKTSSSSCTTTTNDNFNMSTINNTFNTSVTNRDFNTSTTNRDINTSTTNRDLNTSTTNRDLNTSTTNSDLTTSLGNSDYNPNTANNDIDTYTDDIDVDTFPFTNNSNALPKIIIDYKDVVRELASKVNRSQQFFIVVRRGAPFSRILSLWHRQSLKSQPTNVVCVHYSGEDGVDSGAIALEFFEYCMEEMSKVMFPDGSPVNSSYHVQNANFRSCGQIVAASLAQGGRPPCFLEPCCYKATFEEVDMMCISDENLTTVEKELLKEVKSDCTKYTELILENNYTGVIDEKHIDEILGSLKVSFVTRRSLYMKEFMIGLSSYGLDEIIKSHPEECQPLFVHGGLENILPDADYLFSIITPVYSSSGCSRRTVEEKMMDYLQDTIIAFEDEHLSGSKAAIAWNDKKGDADSDEEVSESLKETKGEVFEAPCLSVPKLMGWLTGLQHKPISGERPSVKVHFDHECMEANPNHTVCFPLVSACGRRVTLPVAHMKNEKDFKELFILAFCKGQSFGRP